MPISASATIPLRMETLSIPPALAQWPVKETQQKYAEARTQSTSTPTAMVASQLRQPQA